MRSRYPLAGGERSEKHLRMSSLPRFVRVRQKSLSPSPFDVQKSLAGEFEKLRSRVNPGARIAVAVGSRGIARLTEIVGGVIAELRRAGAQPFIIPAMGSHGGATPEGQTDLLASLGITEASMGVPIRASLEVKQVGTTAEGAAVYCSTEALGADGVVIVNRVKPHTDFFGELGSGLLKMCVVGLGKRTGAAAMHAAASQVGHERAIRGMAGVLLRTAPIVGGVAILEHQFHDTARLVVLRREEMETGEDALLVEARRLMPLLPFEEIDLLIIDWLGKNISGTGMDTNVVNRSVNGYSTWLQREGRPTPFIRRIFVRDVTPESHGNAIGIGLADVTTARLVRAADMRIMGVNALTSLTPHSAKLPIYFETDREAIERTLESVPRSNVSAARVVRIADTLSLGELQISEAAWAEVKGRPELELIAPAHELDFGPDGNLR
jgi:hypothetical protein